MALFATAPAGSGVLSPIYPDLKFRWSVDGLGEVYEDAPAGFLAVWNADTVARAIEYAPGLFTPTLQPHTGHLVNEGAATWDFQSYPFGLAYDFERNKHPTVATVPLETNFSTYQFDLSYITHATGDTRRSVTWPPMRQLFFGSNPTQQANAWASVKSWSRDQLRRPLSHISAPFTAFDDVWECNGGWQVNQHNATRVWGHDDTVNVPDQNGTPRNWNAFDPAHNESGPQFNLALAGGRLGVVLIWMLARWHVQGARPGLRCFSSSYSTPFDQERSICWVLLLFTRATLLGFEWADPDLIREWWGGRDGMGSGLGVKPRQALRDYFNRLAGPDYGGTGGASARRMWQMASPFPGDGHHQPYLGSTIPVCSGQGQCNTNFTFNGKSYGRLFGGEKVFHRGMLLWAVPEVLRAHDYLLTLDATDPLLDPARISELQRYAADLGDFIAETAMLPPEAGAHAGKWRQRSHMFNLNAAENGFESFAAIEAAVLAAIACNPVDCDGSNNNWVFPGTIYNNRAHVFVRQHSRWAPGVGKWYLQAGIFPETEARSCGPPGYALAMGYDADLQRQIDAYPEINPNHGSYDPKHYDVIWRAVELASTELEPLLGASIRLEAQPVTALNDGGGPTTTLLDAAGLRLSARAVPRLSLGTSTTNITPAQMVLQATAVTASNAPTPGDEVSDITGAFVAFRARQVARFSEGDSTTSLDGGSLVFAAAAVAFTNEPTGGGGDTQTQLEATSVRLAAVTVARDSSGTSVEPLLAAALRFEAVAVVPSSTRRSPPRRWPKAVLPELFLDVSGSVDLVLNDGDVAPDVGVRSQVLTALFTDARAPADLLEQMGDDDPRGVWWEEPGERIGSLLWTDERAKLTPQEISRVREHAEAALAFMVTEGIAQRVTVAAARGRGDVLELTVTIERGNATAQAKAWAATEAAEIELAGVRLRLLTQ